jgi:hypothetical protein
MRTAPLLRRLAALLAVGVVASCHPDQSTSPPAPPNADLTGDALGGGTETATGGVGTLLQCKKLPYASNTEVIGPTGGELRIGPHTLRIPPGALTRWVTITGEAPSDKARSVRFTPQGLQFIRPASLTLSYEDCSLVVGLVPRIAYTTDALLILYYVPSFNNLFNQTVTGEIEHFSRYAAAW